jgi:hypothetical protein
VLGPLHRRRIALGLIALTIILGIVIISSDALARRGVAKPRQVLSSLKDRVVALMERVAAIEETDCGCAGVLEPVCVNNRTYVNLCEASCALAHQGVGDFEELIQFGVPRGIEIHGGPCEASLRICGKSVCTTGHICVDGECVVDRCNGFSGSNDPCPCPRGLRCAVPPEVCGSHCICNGETGTSVCTQACYPMCVPDESQ